jgi:hypothetical protein
VAQRNLSSGDKLYWEQGQGEMGQREEATRVTVLGTVTGREGTGGIYSNCTGNRDEKTVRRKMFYARPGSG